MAADYRGCLRSKVGVNPLIDSRLAAPPEEDKFAQLEKLAELNKQGILTDEEFAAEKAKILSS